MFLIALVFLTAAWLFATFTFPLGWDQGIFAWVGSVINDGGLPYRDAVDLKGPLPYYVFAFVQTIMGSNAWGIRVFDAMALAGAAMALRTIVNRLSPSPAGSWAGCALVLAVGLLGFWGMAQPDGWVGLLMIASVAILAGGGARPEPARVALAAAIAGLGVLVKPFYLGLALLPVVYPWLRRLLDRTPDQEASMRRDLRTSTGALVASLTPAILAIAWFAGNDALDSLIEVHLLYSAQAYAGMGEIALMHRVRGLIDVFVRIPPLLIALPAIVVGVAHAWRRDPVVTALLMAWLILAIAFVGFQGRFYRYQMLPAFPPLVVFATSGFASVLARRSVSDTTGETPSPLMRLFVMTNLITVLMLLVAQPVRETYRAARYVGGAITEQAYLRTFAELPSYSAADQHAMAQVLRERTQRSDRIAVLGYNAGLLYLADRRSPTRFGFSYPFTHGTDTEISARFHDEFVAAKLQDPPEWIVVGAVDGARLSLERRLAGHPSLASIVQSHYCFEAEVGHYVLFARCLHSDARRPNQL